MGQYALSADERQCTWAVSHQANINKTSGFIKHKKAKSYALMEMYCILWDDNVA